MSKVWRILLSIVFIAIIVFAGFIVYVLQSRDLQTLYICATSGAPVPSKVCEYYFFHFRGSKEDIAELENGVGLAMVFQDKAVSDTYDWNKQKAYMDFLISKGIHINKINPINGESPLHAAVIFNDVELAKYLLAHGADPALKSTSIERLPDYGDKTPLETAKLMQIGSNNKQDRSAMIRLLEEQNGKGKSN